jgi:hypothetical protein
MGWGSESPCSELRRPRVHGGGLGCDFHRVQESGEETRCHGFSCAEGRYESLIRNERAYIDEEIESRRTSAYRCIPVQEKHDPVAPRHSHDADEV